MRDCNCLIPVLEGAGQHSPGCAIFKCDARRVHPYSSGFYIVCRRQAGHEGDHECDVTWNDESEYALPPLSRAGNGHPKGAA